MQVQRHLCGLGLRCGLIVCVCSLFVLTKFFAAGILLFLGGACMTLTVGVEQNLERML